jgi:hypothetical protein
VVRWCLPARVNLPSHQIRNLMFGSIEIELVVTLSSSNCIRLGG